MRGDEETFGLYQEMIFDSASQALSKVFVKRDLHVLTAIPSTEGIRTDIYCIYHTRVMG